MIQSQTVEHRLPGCDRPWAVGNRWLTCKGCGARHDLHGPAARAWMQAQTLLRGVSAIQSDPKAREAFDYLRARGVTARQYQFALDQGREDVR